MCRLHGRRFWLTGWMAAYAEAHRLRLLLLLLLLNEMLLLLMQTVADRLRCGPFVLAQRRRRWHRGLWRLLLLLLLLWMV